MALFPVGTPRDTLVAIDGILHTVCKGDPFRCDGKAWDASSVTYYDAEGNVTDACNAVSVDLPVGVSCCSCNVVCALVPEAFDDAPNAPVFAVNYPVDGTPIPDLAAAGDVKVGYIAAPSGCSMSHWDSIGPVAPAGYKYVHILTVGLQ